MTQVQTHLPKTKRVWPMKINVICTVHACVANALFHVYVGVGDYTLPLDHSVLVW